MIVEAAAPWEARRTGRPGVQVSRGHKGRRRAFRSGALSQTPSISNAYMHLCVHVRMQFDAQRPARAIAEHLRDWRAGGETSTARPERYLGGTRTTHFARLSLAAVLVETRSDSDPQGGSLFPRGLQGSRDSDWPPAALSIEAGKTPGERTPSSLPRHRSSALGAYECEPASRIARQRDRRAVGAWPRMPVPGC